MSTQNTLPKLFQSNTEESKLYDTAAFADLQLQQTPSTTSPYSDHLEQKINHHQFPQSPPKPPSDSQNKIFANHGYKKISKICDTLQGELYKAKELRSNKLVAIKSANKLLYSQGIAIEGDITFCVSEDIIKEALILQHLTMNNKCIGGYIIQFINFFESQTHYYLVIEYVESQINLKEFVNICYKYIENGKLKLKDYQKTIKYLFWQLSVTIQWLHDSMKCCHMDLCLENIMLANCKFIKGTNGYYTINPAICIKLIDFGVSEFFHIDTASFDCTKQCLSLENEPYCAPKVYSDAVYDACSADMWSLGMVLYECLTAKRLYKPMEIWQSKALQSHNIALFNNGYWSLHNNRLATYISVHDMNKFSADSLNLLIGLLKLKQEERLNGMEVLRQKWFKMYFDNYHQQIEKKAKSQKEQLQKQKHSLRNFPFYQNSKFRIP